MKPLVPKDKLSKKQQRALHLAKRVTWGFDPRSRKVESAKAYQRPQKRRPEHYPDGALHRWPMHGLCGSGVFPGYVGCVESLPNPCKIHWRADSMRPVSWLAACCGTERSA